MKPFYIILDNIRSLENVGSMFRTSDAMGVSKIFLCGITGSPPRDKISKTALGAEKSVPFEYYSHTWRLIEKLKKEGVQIVCLEQTKNSIPYNKFKPKFPIALVVGNEVKGISNAILNRADRVIDISMKGKKESLNVAVAFGVAGFEIQQYR